MAHIRTAIVTVPWAGLLACFFLVAGAKAQPPEQTSFAELQVATPVLSLPAAVQYGLENNPALAATRKQKGIAAARLVIAETYPFNPILETRVQSARGPEAAGVTNNLPFESLLLLEVEMRGQGKHRRAGAAAALSRTDWEIAAQEQALAVQIVKAYTNQIYRQEKMSLIEETLKVNEQLVENVRSLVKLGRLRAADLIVAQSEVADTTDLVSSAREALTAAKQEMFKALGVLDLAFETDGTLETTSSEWDAAALDELALSRRADLQAKKMAVAEAAASVRLAEANRLGNPVVGPAYAYDPSKVRMVGAQVSLPLPIGNTRRGEVLQSEAEHALAVLTLRQTELNIRQDVAAAHARLELAERRADQFKRKSIPALKQAIDDMEKLFLAAEPGVDLLKVIDIRRKLLRARDGYLDALWSVRQARADVLAATGEPALEWGKPAAPAAAIGLPQK